jgi:hypothetical protein
MLSDKIRACEKGDLERLKAIIDTSGLFPSELLEGMMTDFFTNPQTQDIWLTKLIHRSL